MRKITVLSMVSLDGVMQSPGSPDEDTSGGFKYGGWIAPFDDEVSAKMMERLMEPSDLLLGRKTFEIWENYWPQHAENWPSVNEVSKFVVSNTRKNSKWENSVFVDGLAGIEALKNSTGSGLQVWGSGQLARLLFEHDLVDELWLMIHPIILGDGKKLFTDGAIAAAFTLTETTITPSGVIVAHYKRAGNVKTGTVGG